MDPKPPPIIDAQPGHVVSGFVVSRWQSPAGEPCLVVAGGGRCCAYPVDPAIRLDPGAVVELRTVLLEKQDAPAWEVYIRQPGSPLQLVPGQHCVPRTAPTEQWLQEIQTQILPDLVAHAERSRADRLAQQDARRAINPAGQPELLYVTALATARKELLGPDYARVCRAAEAADHRCAKAKAALRRHDFVGERRAGSSPGPGQWVRRWRKNRRLRQHLKRAQAWHHRMQAQRRRLERAADAPETIARIDQRARELVNTDHAHRQQLALLEQEEKRASRTLSEAQALVRYLQQHLGSPVTLQQTTVKGHIRWLPTIPRDARLRANLPAQAPGLASPFSGSPSITSKPLCSNHPPQPNAQVFAGHGCAAEKPTPPRHAKSNGVGMKI